MNMELLNLIAPAILVGTMMTLTLVPLGQVVLQRGIIFIDLAVAQVASLGFVAALFLNWDYVYVAQALALLLAISSAVLFRFIEQWSSRYLEAFIGLTYVFSATLALLLLSYHPQGAEHFEGLLSGELLFVSWNKILSHLPIYIGIMCFWRWVPSVCQGFGFYLIFALVITSAVQLVGVFMVFTFLISPALMMAMTHKHLSSAYAVTMISFTVGIILSLAFDIPTSPTVILSIIVFCLLFIVRSRPILK